MSDGGAGGSWTVYDIYIYIGQQVFKRTLVFTMMKVDKSRSRWLIIFNWRNSYLVQKKGEVGRILVVYYKSKSRGKESI